MKNVEDLTKKIFLRRCMVLVARGRTSLCIGGKIDEGQVDDLARYIVAHETDIADEVIAIWKENAFSFESGSLDLKKLKADYEAFEALVEAKYPTVMKLVAGTDPTKIENWEKGSIPASQIPEPKEKDQKTDPRAAAIKQIVDRVVDHGKFKLIKERNSRNGMQLGHLVVIKSCHDEDPDEAIMGIYVGSVSTNFGPNPVFFVPKLQKTLAGYESWWQAIPKEDMGLSCDVMRAKYNFTWADIEKSIEEQLNRLGLKAVVVKVKE